MIKKHAKKAAMLICVLAMLLSSCSNAATQSSSAPAPQSSSPASTPGSAPAASSAPEAPAAMYPVQNAPKLTWWTSLDSKVSKVASGLNETIYAKQLMEETGIEVDFIQPAMGQELEQFNLMIASNDLKDIVEFRWLERYPGGPEMAFKQSHMLKLTPYMDEYAPDFMAYLKANPNVDKMAKTDSSDYYGFMFIRGDISICVFQGPIVRKDWLDDLGLAEPETIDEWTHMLREFKDKKGATAPFQGEVGSYNATSGAYPFKRGGIVGAYGTTMDFYLDPVTNTFKYGPLEPGFKDFVVQMNSWYKEGLMGRDFMTDDRKALNALVLSGDTGATIGNAGGGLGTYDAAFASAGDTTAKLIGIKYPVLNKGDVQMFGHIENPIASNVMVSAISPKISEDKVIAAMKLLNYGYSEAGDRLYNYGKEGESYNMDNGYPRYTDIILKPAQNSVMENLAMYGRASYNGPFVQSKEYFEQVTSAQNQLDAIAKWMQTEAGKTERPPVTPSEDENRDYNRIYTELTTYLDEWVTTAISGKIDPEATYDQFIAELKNIGVDRAVEIQNAAYQRYLAR